LLAFHLTRYAKALFAVRATKDHWLLWLSGNFNGMAARGTLKRLPGAVVWDLKALLAMRTTENLRHDESEMDRFD